MTNIARCHWVSDAALYQHYHDVEWGRVCVDDAALFEQLCLEGQQAGLSWWTVLQKRDRYRQHFFQHPIADIASFSDEKLLQEILTDAGVIRHRGKIFAIRHNAQVWLRLQQQFAIDFANPQLSPMVSWLWHFAFLSKPEILNRLPIRQRASSQMPERNQLRSYYLSMQLKKVGFKFVGHQIAHAFMQAVGMFNEHAPDCFCTVKTKAERMQAIQHYFPQYPLFDHDHSA